MQMTANGTQKVSGALGPASRQPLGHRLAVRQEGDARLDPRAEQPADCTPTSPRSEGRGPQAPGIPTLRAGPRPGTFRQGEEAPRSREDNRPTLGPDRLVVTFESPPGPTSPYTGTSGPAAAPLRPHLWP